MTPPRSFRLLAALEGEYAPSLRRSQTGYRTATRRLTATPDPVTEGVLVPVLNWTMKGRDLPPEGDPRLITLDLSAAYIAAAACVRVAYGPLERTPGIGTIGLPGYYLVDIDPDWWQDRRLISPLGRARPRPGAVWLAQPTVALLDDLSRSGLWPDVTVRDAWTCPDAVSLSSWTSHIRDLRTSLIKARDKPSLGALKLAYSQSIQVLEVGTVRQAKANSWRPDWAHAIRAMHGANFWRKAWRLAEAGHGPVRIHSKDQMDMYRSDFAAALHPDSGPPLIRYDSTGITIGSFKEKTED